jgi:hypothetical protein
MAQKLSIHLIRVFFFLFALPAIADNAEGVEMHFIKQFTKDEKIFLEADHCMYFQVCDDKSKMDHWLPGDIILIKQSPEEFLCRFSITNLSRNQTVNANFAYQTAMPYTEDVKSIEELKKHLGF